MGINADPKDRAAVAENLADPGVDLSGERFVDPAASDAPLERPEEDLLDRARLARLLADGICTLDADRGFVLGLQGAWGTGKTTLINFIKRDLDGRPAEGRPITMVFNPWWFGSSHDILVAFFLQLSAVIGKRNPGKGLRKIANLVGTLGSIVAPLSYVSSIGLVATTVARATAAMRRGVDMVAARYEKDLNSTRRDLENALRESRQRIVVFVDDLDRLGAGELKQMLAIVKAIASLPNVVYVLSLDRGRAASVLASHGEPDGAAFLDKVIQVSVDVPHPTPLQMQRIFESRLLQCVDIKEVTGREDRERLVSVFREVLEPLIKTPRDANRYLNAVALWYPGKRDDVDAVDFLALQAVRLFAPDVYYSVGTNPKLYTGAANDRELVGLEDGAKRAHLYDAVVDLAAEPLRVPVRRGLELVFPKVVVASNSVGYGESVLDQWVRDRRACSPDSFPLYFAVGTVEGYFGEAEYKVLLASTASASEFAKRLRLLAEEEHWSGRGRSRLAMALELLRIHDQGGFAPLDPVEALVGLADAADAMSIPADAEIMGLYTNEWRAWYLAADVIKHCEDQVGLLSAVISRSHLLTLPLDWLRSCGIIAKSVAEGRSSTRDLLLSTEAVEQIKPVALAKLYELADAQSLHNQVGFMDMLFDWCRWDTEGTRAYVAHLVASDEGLMAFLLTKLRPRDSDREYPESMIRMEVQQIMSDFELLVDLQLLRDRARQVLDLRQELPDETRNVLTTVANWGPQSPDN